MERLKTLRLEKGLYQKDVASFLGVDRTTYVKYELGSSTPNHDILAMLADFYGVSVDYILGRTNLRSESTTSNAGVKIPVLGNVQAGIPVEAIEDIIDYEEITQEMASRGEFFALQVRGDSMEPKFSEGDVVIVKKQSTADSGDIVIALVNGDDATIKKLKYASDGIYLLPLNPSYEPLFFSKEDIERLPVTICGVVVELRAKFKHI